MSEDIGSASPVQGAEPAPAAPRAPARRGSGLLALVALAALLLAAFAAWRAWSIGREQAQFEGTRDALAARIDDATRGLDQRKREFDSLRTRLADTDSVNKSLREELLALGERSRHLEDAVANLSEQRAGSRDALALNEAEFLLQQGQERLALFHDAAATLSAYRLADSALAAAEDPALAGVRQTIAAERAALEAARPLDTGATLATLERLRGSLATLPLPRIGEGEPAASRWQRFLAQFVRVSHGGAGIAGTRDAVLARSLAAVDLLGAETALFARDGDAFHAALGRARGDVAAAFDVQAPATKAILADLDRLAAEPLAPALPELGSALRELRNLRATRALAQPEPRGATP
jgi:uroporphyrin-III C-methyltransferase